MLGKLGAVITVLYQGNEIANKKLWKTSQAFSGALLALLPAIFLLFDIKVTDEDVASIVGGVVALLGVFNSYATVATTKSIGLPGGGDAAPQARASDHDAPTP